MPIIYCILKPWAGLMQQKSRQEAGWKGCCSGYGLGGGVRGVTSPQPRRPDPQGTADAYQRFAADLINAGLQLGDRRLLDAATFG